MARLALNKSTMHKRREQLKLYRRVLPSLDLKRQQLTAELNRMKAEEEALRHEFDATLIDAGERLPMLADTTMDLQGLLEVEAVELSEENLLGVKLPRLDRLQTRVRNYSLLAKPHWVDVVVDRLRQVAELQLRLEVAAERVRRTDHAVRRLTQRVNLFDKVLIPQARDDIQRIRIFLGDLERAAVVRSKLAKSKYQKLTKHRQNQRQRDSEEPAKPAEGAA